MKLFRGVGPTTMVLATLWAPEAVAQTPVAQAPPPAPLASPLPLIAPGVSMTFEEAVGYARAHNPELAVSRARIAAARAEVDVPRARWMPFIGATAQIVGATVNNSSAVYFTPGAVDLPRIGGTPAVSNASAASWSPYVSTLAAIGVRQEVFDFGRITAQVAAADALAETARVQSSAVWLGVRYGIEEAFDAVFAARAVLVAAEEAYGRAVVHRDLAQAWVTQQLRSRIELDRAAADLARFDAARFQARGGVESAQAVLAAAVGYPAPRIDAAGDIPTQASLPTLEEAFRQAAARDPRILEVLARLRAQEARTHAIETERRPNLAVSGTVSGRAGGAPVGAGLDVIQDHGLVPIVPNWDVGVVLDWPIFDATVGARATASRRAEDAVRTEVDVAREVQVSEIQQGWTEANVAQDQLPALQRAVDAAHSNYDQADARFRQGLGSSVELADAETLRADAEVRLAVGRFQIARSRARFARAIAEGL